MNKTLRRFIKSILKEDGIGSNYKTMDNDPYSYEDYPGIDIEVYPDSGTGGWLAQVSCDFSDEYSTPLRTFSAESDANAWARQKAEQAHRYYLSLNPKIS